MITCKFSRPEQIKKFRKLCGESLQIDSMFKSVLALCDDLYNGEIDDDARLGETYTAKEVRAIGAWWLDAGVLADISGVYMMNVIFACAEAVKLDKVKERQTVISVTTMYGSRQVTTAERLHPILQERYGALEYNEAAAAVCQQRKDEYLAKIDPKVRAQAMKMAEEMLK